MRSIAIIAACIVFIAGAAFAQAGRYFLERSGDFSDAEFIGQKPTTSNKAGISFFDVWAQGTRDFGVKDSLIESYINVLAKDVGRCEWSDVKRVTITNKPAQFWAGGSAEKDYIAVTGECRSSDGEPYQALYSYLAGTAGKQPYSCESDVGAKSPEPTQICLASAGCLTAKDIGLSARDFSTINCAEQSRYLIERTSIWTVNSALRNTFPSPPSARVLCIQSCYKSDPDADFDSCQAMCSR